MFKIGTGEKRMYKKKKGKKQKLGQADRSDQEHDDDFNPENPDEPSFFDEEMEEESDEEREIQRNFEFVPEIAILVDYTVVKSYLGLLSNEESR